MIISAADVEDMLENDPHMLLVDVRTKEEYDEGHIPGAGCMPVEDICDCLYDEALGERGLDVIANARGMELSDDASVIVLYCRSGNRSAKAAEHMEALGYTNVYDAGGIVDWPGEIITTAEERAAGSAQHGHDCGCGHEHGHGHGHAGHGHDHGHACECGRE